MVRQRTFRGDRAGSVLAATIGLVAMGLAALATGCTSYSSERAQFESGGTTVHAASVGEARSLTDANRAMP